ncbi:MAG TPA: hypothetical protein VGN12_01315 [Pirellulales bacterium]
MIERILSLATIDLIAGTRAAFGFGLGLLLAGRFTQEERRTYGWTLAAVGALTTIPLAWEVLSGKSGGTVSEERFVKAERKFDDYARTVDAEDIA